MAVALLLGTSVVMAQAISGTQFNDNLTGTRAADQMYGLNGNDTVQGAIGSDEVYGGAGNDNVYGNKGVDEVYGGSGQDDLFGGPGADYLNSTDRNIVVDVIDCGAGDGETDRIVRDNEDTTINCSGPDMLNETIVQ